MTGSIQTKKDRKNYYAVLNVYDENGKRKPKWIDTGVPIKGNNKRKADAKLKELLVKHGENKTDFSRDVLFDGYLEQWLETLRPFVSPVTYDSYKVIMDVHLLPFFRGRKLKITDVAPVHLQQYVNAKLKTLSPNTVLKHLANLSKCLNSAVKQNIIPYNPVKRIEMPQKVKFMGAKHYNKEQIERLLECSEGDNLEIAIWLTVFYGLRRSEVLGLAWGAIDFENDSLTIKHTVVPTPMGIYREDRTKNESSHATFPLSGRIRKKLIEWKGKQDGYKEAQPNDYFSNDYVCTYPDGQPIKPDYVSNHFVLLLRKHGLPRIRFHDLRHSSASYLKHLGFDLKDIQVWLRHKDIQTTMNLYTHLDMKAKSNIADRLDGEFNECRKC